MKRPAIAISNQPKRNRSADFVDVQVAILIKDHEGEDLCVEDLLEAARKEMPKFDWDYDKVRNSVDRLAKRGKIDTKYLIRGGKACRVPFLI